MCAMNGDPYLLHISTVIETYNRCFSNEALLSYSYANDIFGMEYTHYVNEMFLRNLDCVFKVLRFISESMGNEIFDTAPCELLKLRCYDILLLRGILKFNGMSLEFKELCLKIKDYESTYGHFYFRYLKLMRLVPQYLSDAQVKDMYDFLASKEGHLGDRLSIDVQRSLASVNFLLKSIKDYIREEGGATIFDDYFSDRMPKDHYYIFVPLFLQDLYYSY